MKSRFRLLAAVATMVVADTGMAEAHTFGISRAGLTDGFLHPIGGLDHVLAMVAVGLWAAQLGGRALWRVPSTFVLMMVMGGALGTFGVPLLWVEGGILASVLALGAAVLLAKKPPLVMSMALVGLFAIFHGHAHGAEIPPAASPYPYGLGFALGTSLLHMIGVGAGTLLTRGGNFTRQLIRVGGGAVVAGGVVMLMGL